MTVKSRLFIRRSEVKMAYMGQQIFYWSCSCNQHGLFKTNLNIFFRRISAFTKCKVENFGTGKQYWWCMMLYNIYEIYIILYDHQTPVTNIDSWLKIFKNFISRLFAAGWPHEICTSYGGKLNTLPINFFISFYWNDRLVKYVPHIEES